MYLKTRFQENSKCGMYLRISVFNINQYYYYRILLILLPLNKN